MKSESGMRVAVVGTLGIFENDWMEGKNAI